MCLFSLDSSDDYPFEYNVFNDNTEYTFYYEILECVIHRLNETEYSWIYHKMFYFPVQRLLSFTWHLFAQTRFAIGSQCENLIASGTSWKKWLLWEIAMSLQPIAFQSRLSLGHLRKERCNWLCLLTILSFIRPPKSIKCNFIHHRDRSKNFFSSLYIAFFFSMDVKERDSLKYKTINPSIPAIAMSSQASKFLWMYAEQIMSKISLIPY